MLPDKVLNPGLLTYDSGALPIALRGPATYNCNISPFRTKQKNRYKVAGVYYFTTSENNILRTVAGYSQAF